MSFRLSELKGSLDLGHHQPHEPSPPKKKSRNPLPKHPSPLRESLSASDIEKMDNLIKSSNDLIVKINTVQEQLRSFISRTTNKDFEPQHIITHLQTNQPMIDQIRENLTNLIQTPITHTERLPSLTKIYETSKKEIINFLKTTNELF